MNKRQSEISSHRISIVLPARNEARSLDVLLPAISQQYPDAEIIVVDDGSTDDTKVVCDREKVRRLVNHYPIGNGGAVKKGVRHASGDLLVLMDADGQHDVKDINRLIAKLDEGIDLVVGARDSRSQASTGRWMANAFYNRFASWMVGQRVEDLTSGFRATRAKKIKEFLHLMPNGFSYPTTTTMAFFRSGYSVGYVKISARKRIGKSHIRPIRDGMRFLMIMFRICTLYSPLKLFLPISGSFLCLGMGYYAFTYANGGRFTNMSALLLSIGVLVFLIGLVSEQITMLLYQGHHDEGGGRSDRHDTHSGSKIGNGTREEI